MDDRFQTGEVILLAILGLGLVVGTLSAFVAPDYYEFVLSAEDGPLEWATAIALFLASATCFRRVWAHRALGARFVAITLLAAIILLFGAGEEISWGQRRIGWTSGEFWQEHNAQAETNLHNLMVGDVKVNRVLFGVTLTLVLFIYFVILPVVAARLPSLRSICARWHIPLPRARHSVLFFLSLVVMSLIPSSRAPEIGEFALGLLLAAVVIYPANKADIL